MSQTWLKMLIRVVVSICVLAVVLVQVNIHKVAADLQKLSLGVILLAWGYYSFCQLLSSYRWQLFLTAKGIHVPLTKLFAFYMVGMFFNNFMPGAVGGDAVKAYDLYRYTRQGKFSLISVFLERFTGLVGLSLISILTLAIGFRSLNSPVILTGVVGTALVLVLAVLAFWWPPLSNAILPWMGRFFPQHLGEKVQQLYAALAEYGNHRSTLVGAIGLSVVIQLLYALYYALISAALGISINPLYFILFLPLITLVTLLPISLGGLGVREALMIFLFSQVGVAAADILAVSLTVHLLGMLLSLWGGGLLLFRKPTAVSAGVVADA